MVSYRRVLSVFLLCGFIILLQYFFPSPVSAACSGIFCGQVFIDTNGNGVMDSGEQNYTGATVTLNSASGSDVESAQTTSGGYSFSPNVCVAGNYTVTLTVPSGYTATTGTTGSGSIAVGPVESGLGSCESHPLTCSTQQYCTPVGGSNGPPKPTICIPQTVCFQNTTVWNHKDPEYSPSTFNFGIKLITYSISGNISDNSNANVAGVTVSLSGPSSVNTTTDASGNFTASNLVPGNYTASISVPAGYIANGVTSQAVTLNANKTGVNFKLTKVFQISGTVFNDTNEDGKIDNGETGYQGIAVKLTNGSGTQTATSDVNGNYSFQVTSTAGNSTVTISGIPVGWFNSNPASQTVASTLNTAGLNFGIALENTIAGNVFIDPNKNGIKDTNEGDYLVTPTITSSGGTVATTAIGTYTISNLVPGTYTITYGSLPVGYYMTSPLSGPPISFKVTVGSGCSVTGAPGATCNGVNIANLNFGISNTYPWYQSTCGDIRNDNGILDTVPTGLYGLIAASSCNNPGIAFTGNTNASFAPGQASNPTNQIVGGATYPELYSGPDTPLQTGYSALVAKAQQAGVTPIDLSTKCTLSNCTLTSSFTHGIYQANGNLTLNSYTFPANQDYIILVNGNLTINGAISVPVGSTALFSTSGNITVNPTVGTVATVGTSSLDGWYIAGGSFILPTQGNCNDLRLNIAGTVVVDAMGTAGSFQNNRDLCGGDTTSPAVSFLQRLDMILNAPQFIQNQQNLSKEVAP